MTAEVAVLNKTAVALAADSTVTVSMPHSGEVRRKTYNTANKLFTLSRYHPVGVMIYGDAEFMGVPWETIIKTFRKAEGDESSETIDDWVKRFIEFLEHSTGLFPETSQRERFAREVAGYFIHGVLDEIDETIKQSGEDLEQAAITKIAAAVIEKHADETSQHESLPYLSESFPELLSKNCSKEIEEAIDYAFSGFELDEQSRVRLREIAASIICGNIFPTNMSGIVIAGFGDMDLFPVVRSFSPLLVVEGTLIYRDEEDLGTEINDENNGAVIPFAQSDVVDAFIRGLDNSYASMLDNYSKKLFDELPSAVLEEMEGIDSEVRQQVQEKLERLRNDSGRQLKDGLEKYMYEAHIRPLLDVVAVLPKDELAGVAEALVNLTSVKRKMSRDIETVGGPVDVAVISKCDGFIWISRKHYFDRNLNPQFIENYFRE